MRVYIAGPISGHKNGNRAAFDFAARAVKMAGHEPVIPHEICITAGAKSWSECMEVCLGELTRSDIVLLLLHWVRSSGARVEFETALRLKIPILTESQILDAAGLTATALQKRYGFVTNASPQNRTEHNSVSQCNVQ